MCWEGMFGHNNFLTRRLGNVGTEMSLSVLAYDLLRPPNIIGGLKMIRALT
jgi:hypothetical protein